MKQHYFWQAVDGIGLEHLLLRQTADGIFADSWVIGEVEGEPFRLHYTLRCDRQWRTRVVTAAVLTPELRHIEVTVDEEGVWTDRFNNAIEELDGNSAFPHAQILEHETKTRLSVYCDISRDAGLIDGAAAIRAAEFHRQPAHRGFTQVHHFAADE